MNNSITPNISEINWEFILILKEFIRYFSIEQLKELSLISKLIRLKYNRILFKQIRLNGAEFGRHFYKDHNLIKDYFNLLKMFFDIGDRSEFISSKGNGLKAKSTFKGVEGELTELRYLVNCINLDCVKNIWDFLFPVLNSLTNLTILKLSNCSLSFIVFDRLLGSLNKLDTLEAECTSFEKLPNNDFELKDVRFPATLHTLIIYDCYTISNVLFYPTSIPLLNKFYKKEYTKISTDFILPPITIPSLKSLSFDTDYKNENGLNQFILKNSQLESINIDSGVLDQFKLDLFRLSKNLKKLELICDREIITDCNIPTLNYIKELEFYLTSPDFYPTLESLCLACTNLTDLCFVIDSTDGLNLVIKKILTNIIPKSNNLRALSLWMSSIYLEPLDFNKLNSIRKLTLHINFSNLINLEFDNSNNLKEVNFYYYENDVNVTAIKQKFSNFEDWRFIFSEGSVKGYRV